MSLSKPATQTVVAQQAELLASLPFADARDFEDANRGLIAPIEEPVLGDDGTVSWDNSTYDFLQDDAPDTVNPSLWRQSRLAAIGGLFEGADGIYQVRGMDPSNTSIVEGNEGVIVFDTLLSVQTAAAAVALYRKHGASVRSRRS